MTSFGHHELLCETAMDTVQISEQTKRNMAAYLLCWKSLRLFLGSIMWQNNKTQCMFAVSLQLHYSYPYIPAMQGTAMQCKHCPNQVHSNFTSDDKAATSYHHSGLSKYSHIRSKRGHVLFAVRCRNR